MNKGTYCLSHAHAHDKQQADQSIDCSSKSTTFLCASGWDLSRRSDAHFMAAAATVCQAVSKQSTTVEQIPSQSTHAPLPYNIVSTSTSSSRALWFYLFFVSFFFFPSSVFSKSTEDIKRVFWWSSRVHSLCARLLLLRLLLPLLLYITRQIGWVGGWMEGRKFFVPVPCRDYRYDGDGDIGQDQSMYGTHRFCTR